jgi:uncharacterized protein (UPF0548 family)
MFLTRRPSPATIERFLDRCRDLPLSYGPVGILATQSAAGRLDEQIVAIGHGPADFERARAALIAWKHFDIGWVEVFPNNPSVEAGTVVGILIRHLGFWSLNGARVVYRLGESVGQGPFGFAYGTLTSHAESGEESFDVFIDAQSGDVMYRIRARSWPQAALTWIGQPIVRLLQAHFRRDSANAIRRAVSRVEWRS